MRVLLVDDHAIVRRGLRELLTEDLPDVEIDEAATGEEALSLAREQPYGLVILDINMPRRGGLDALKQLRERWPRLPVVILSHYAEEEYAIRALRAGASAYLTKSAAPEELIRAVRKALDGGKYVTESLAERLAAQLVETQQPLHQLLSDRELQVLRLMGSGKGTKEIAAQLALSEKTVSTYRSRMLEKMGMTATADLIRYAVRMGLAE